MKKRTLIRSYVLWILGTFLIALAGCGEDFFDRKAGDRITPDQHYFTAIDAEVSASGAIINLQEAIPNFIVLTGLMSDELDVTKYASPDLIEINHQIFSSGNPYTNPSDFYKVIINMNEVMANIDKVAANDREFDDYITHYAKGALISMRAWTYFTLVRLYNQAAYIPDNLTSLPEDLAKDALSKVDMIDTLINQLLPYVFDASVGVEREEFRIEYYVNTKALLGELYLEKGDYANAVAYLKLACESYLNDQSVFKVDNTYQDEQWESIFLNAESATVENIAVIPFSSTHNQLNPLADLFGYNRDYALKPSTVLLDSFNAQIPAAGEPGDLFRGLGVTYEVDSAVMETDPDFAYITKYAVDSYDPASSDIIISRAADLHLLMAEAYNRMGDEESQNYALIFLNQGINKESPKPTEYARWARNLGIRGRVYLTPREIPEEITGENRTRMIEDMIIAERAMELACEGKRWFDLVRVAERRGEPEFLADKVAAKFEGTPMYNTIHDQLMQPDNWYLPFD